MVLGKPNKSLKINKVFKSYRDPDLFLVIHQIYFLINQLCDDAINQVDSNKIEIEMLALQRNFKIISLKIFEITEENIKE